MTISLASAFGVLTPEDSLSFGKYKGKELMLVVLEDPSYILWCASTTNSVFSKDLLDEAVKRCATSISKKRHNIYGCDYDDAGEVDDEYEQDVYDIFHDPDMGDR